MNGENKRIKIILRIIGITLLATGITLTAIGFSNFGNFDNNLFSLTFFGLPCLAGGLALTIFSFIQNIARFIQNEHTPLINEFSEDISPAIKNYASAIKEGIDENDALVCSCGKRNKNTNKFCSECGKTLQLVCPKCGNQTDVNDKFCPNCAQKLD